MSFIVLSHRGVLSVDAFHAIAPAVRGWFPDCEGETDQALKALGQASETDCLEWVESSLGIRILREHASSDLESAVKTFFAVEQARLSLDFRKRDLHRAVARMSREAGESGRAEYVRRTEAITTFFDGIREKEDL